MPISYASDRFTVTGGKISGTVTSATATTLTCTAAFTAYDNNTLPDRVVWIHAGTGAGQFRNIASRDSADTVTIDTAWDVTPDATSQFLVGYDPDDFAAVSTVGCVIVKFGENNTTPGIRSGRGYVVNFTSYLTIGDNTTKTFVHFPKGAYNFDQSITTSDSTYPWSTTAQTILIQDNACLQFGNLRYDIDVGYGGCMVTQDQQEASWDRRLINTHANATCILNMYASTFQHLGRNVNSGNNRGFITVQWQGSCTSTIRDCVFGEGFNFRPFSPNIDVKTSKFLNAQFAMSKFNATPENLTLAGEAPVANSSNSDDNGTPQTIKNCTIISYGHSPATSSGAADGLGDVQAPKVAGTDNVLLNVTWNRRIVHASPPTDTFLGGATITEQYEFTATARTPAQIAIPSANTWLLPSAGNIVGNYTGTTDSNGRWGPTAITTRFADADGGANDAWTAGVLPYWNQQSKDNFKVRVRLPDKLMFSAPVDFADYNTLGGRAVSIGVTLLNDANYTADGSLVTGVTLTDDRAAPVSWNSKSWGWTIVGNRTTNPSLTLQDIYNWWKYHGSQNANAPGTSVNAGEVHNVFASLTTTANGEYYNPANASQTGGVVTDAATLSYGVRIVDESGNPFPGVTSMQADDGTYYIPPVQYTLTLTSNVTLVGAEIRIYDLDNTPAGSLGTELAGTESNGAATFTYVYTGSGNLIWIQILKDGYVEYGQEYTTTANNSSLTATLVQDTNA